VGRHVSAERRASPRSGLAVALAGIAALICVSGFAGQRLWRRFGASTPAALTASGRAPSPRSPWGPDPAQRPASAAPATVAVTVTGPRCPIFVRVPGGDILVNRVLLRGRSVSFYDQRLSVVLGDASAALVHVNGRLRPPGPAGHRAEFTATRP
jgi:hypothetical protein